MCGSVLRAALLTCLALACGGGGITPIVIYSPHGRDLLTLFQHRFERLHPDVVVHWLDMGSQEVYDPRRAGFAAAAVPPHVGGCDHPPWPWPGRRLLRRLPHSGRDRVRRAGPLAGP